MRQGTNFVLFFISFGTHEARGHLASFSCPVDRRCHGQDYTVLISSSRIWFSQESDLEKLLRWQWDKIDYRVGEAKRLMGLKVN